MPKFLVKITETLRFEVSVEASTQERAEEVAWEVFPSIGETDHDSVISETVTLPADDEVEFDESFLTEEKAA